MWRYVRFAKSDTLFLKLLFYPSSATILVLTVWRVGIWMTLILKFIVHQNVSFYNSPVWTINEKKRNDKKIVHFHICEWILIYLYAVVSFIYIHIFTHTHTHCLQFDKYPIFSDILKKFISIGSNSRQMLLNVRPPLKNWGRVKAFWPEYITSLAKKSANKFMINFMPSSCRYFCHCISVFCFFFWIIFFHSSLL